MLRIPLITLLSLVFAVPAFAQYELPAAAPPVDLEAVAIKIMLKAFQVGDHDTVEMLFDKLPLESKKQFLCEATEMLTLDWNKTVSDGNWDRLSIAEMMFVWLQMIVINDTLLAASDLEQSCNIFYTVCEVLQEYIEGKTTQTELLGRLMASLLE